MSQQDDNNKCAAKVTGDKLVVAISSRALFDLSASHEVFESEGLQAYSQYQIAHESDALAPGPAFAMVQKLLRINDLLGRDAVEVILLSRNSADTGLRIFNSIHHYGLEVRLLPVAKALIAILRLFKVSCFCRLMLKMLAVS